MNIISVTALLLLYPLSGSFIILLAITIGVNTRAAVEYRATLAIQLEQSRIGKMLTALDIDTGHYLSRQCTIKIRQYRRAVLPATTRVNVSPACSNTSCWQKLSISATTKHRCRNSQKNQVLSVGRRPALLSLTVKPVGNA